MRLEESSIEFNPQPDGRPRIVEPPPVRLITVEDARLVAGAGVERALDAFYVGLLRFEREPAPEFPVYRSANFRLHFDIDEPPIQRDALRPLGIEVPSLDELEHQFIDAEIEYVRQRGLNPGQDALIVLDPAGNWLQINESREVG